MPISDQARAQMREIAARYPSARSALLPMLHLAQSEEDAITTDGINACAEVLGITPAEVTAVATFYTMYKRERVGKHHIGVCINTMCGLLGGDAVWDAVVEVTGASHNTTTADGEFSRADRMSGSVHPCPGDDRRLKFMDDVTPASAVEILDRLRRGEQVQATRGPVIRDFEATERTLAFPDDGLADAPSVDDKMLAGLKIAREQRMQGGNA